MKLKTIKYMVASLLMMGCNPFNYYPDSLLEEEIEEYILEEIGVFVDFSGESWEPAPDDYEVQLGLTFPF